MRSSSRFANAKETASSRSTGSGVAPVTGRLPSPCVDPTSPIESEASGEALGVPRAGFRGRSLGREIVPPSSVGGRRPAEPTSRLARRRPRSAIVLRSLCAAPGGPMRPSRGILRRTLPQDMRESSENFGGAWAISLAAACTSDRCLPCDLVESEALDVPRRVARTPHVGRARPPGRAAQGLRRSAPRAGRGPGEKKPARPIFFLQSRQNTL